MIILFSRSLVLLTPSRHDEQQAVFLPLVFLIIIIMFFFRVQKESERKSNQTNVQFMISFSRSIWSREVYGEGEASSQGEKQKQKHKTKCSDRHVFLLKTKNSFRNRLSFLWLPGRDLWLQLCFKGNKEVKDTQRVQQLLDRHSESSKSTSLQNGNNPKNYSSGDEREIMKDRTQENEKLSSKSFSFPVENLPSLFSLNIKQNVEKGNTRWGRECVQAKWQMIKVSFAL